MSGLLKSRSASGRLFSEGVGYKEYFHYDHVTDTYVIEQVSDVTETVENMRAAYASVDERAKFDGDPGVGTHVAQIPHAILFAPGNEWMMEGDSKRLHKWLNDPDNRAFRSRPGRL